VVQVEIQVEVVVVVAEPVVAVVGIKERVHQYTAAGPEDLRAMLGKLALAQQMWVLEVLALAAEVVAGELLEDLIQETQIDQAAPVVKL
jgi:hypothetical protein